MTLRLPTSTSKMGGGLVLFSMGCLIFTMMAPQIGHAQTAEMSSDAEIVVKVLHKFPSNVDGAVVFPDALVRDKRGNLYGNTEVSRFQCCPLLTGTVYELEETGTFRTLHKFFREGTPSGLILDERGNLYGTTVNEVFELNPRTTEETILHMFTGQSLPAAGLVRDAEGNLYGTRDEGHGYIFEITTEGNYKVLYRFTGGRDGSDPTAGLILDREGNLYGTTSEGGVINRNCPFRGCGVVFKLDKSRRESVLYRFKGYRDGAIPFANLVMDSAGNLFGTTSFGGSLTGEQCQAIGCGVVFEIDTTGKYTVLHAFNGTDGTENSTAVLLSNIGLLLDEDTHSLYGTTLGGGAHSWGTLFELKSSTTGTAGFAFTVVYNFSAPAIGGVIRDAHGNLYTATFGGLLQLSGLQ